MDNLENKLRLGKAIKVFEIILTHISVNVEYFREADLPPYAHNIAKRELKRLKKMSPQMPEYPMIRHYLELVADLPWGKFSTERIDIKKSKHVGSQITYRNLFIFLIIFFAFVGFGQ